MTMLSFTLLLMQVDIQWPKAMNAYVMVVLIVTHNLIIWLHVTQSMIEVSTKLSLSDYFYLFVCLSVCVPWDILLISWLLWITF